MRLQSDGTLRANEGGREMKDARGRKGRATTRGAGALLVVAAVLLTGCNFDVTNPGPVADEFLDDPAAYEAIVNGIGREMNYALNVVAMDVGVRTREVMAVRNNSWEGVTFDAFLGQATRDVPGYLDPWGHAQQARWIGDDGIRRFQEELEQSEYESSPVVARTHLWTGFAYRTLGEYFCQVAYDMGPALPGSDALEKAEARFGTAIQIGGAAGESEVVTAARAARASVRINLGDWAGAVEDAAQVPTDFSFVLPYFTTGEWRYYNAWAQGLEAGAYTVWNTPYEDYYQETGDPRTPWSDSGEELITDLDLDVPEAPFYVQEKYEALDDAIELASGEEARLIEAEAMLEDGDVDGAMSALNELRARAGVDPWPEPADMEEAWTFFKRERGIELWLEGRRLADFKRWDENSNPGALAPEEMGGTAGGLDLSNRALCLPIPQNEIDANPNLGG